jgi:hypothetical protein
MTYWGFFAKISLLLKGANLLITCSFNKDEILCLVCPSTLFVNLQRMGYSVKSTKIYLTYFYSAFSDICGVHNLDYKYFTCKNKPKSNTHYIMVWVQITFIVFLLSKKTPFYII